jgi:hypothetical protein
MKAVRILLVLFVLAGCSTVEKPGSGAPPADITVVREPSTSDGLFRMLFAVDGRPLAQLNPGEEYSFQVPAGNHSFRYVLGVYDCATEVEVASGETYVYLLTRGCVIEQLDDRYSGAARPTGAGAGSATTWAAEMEAREAREAQAREAEDESYVTW